MFPLPPGCVRGVNDNAYCNVALCVQRIFQHRFNVYVNVCALKDRLLFFNRSTVYVYPSIYSLYNMSLYLCVIYLF